MPAFSPASTCGRRRALALACMLFAGAFACGCAAPGAADGMALEPIRFARGFSDLATTRGYVRAPRPQRFSVCYGNTCRQVATIGLEEDVWDGVRAVFRPAPADAAGERARIALAIARIEAAVGLATGTWRDRGENDAGRGEEGQMDCVDEANNTSVYLALLDGDGLLRWHRPGAPVSRGVTRLLPPHFTATIVEDATGARFAVDSWFGDNGQAPYIVALAEWQRGWKPRVDAMAGGETGAQAHD